MEEKVIIDKCGHTFCVPKDKLRIIAKIQDIDENDIITIKENNSITKIKKSRFETLYDF